MLGAMQKIVSPCCTPCPMMRLPQLGHTGASAWIAHSSQSKVMVQPAHPHLEALVVVIAALHASALGCLQSGVALLTKPQGTMVVSHTAG
jgi:hypothetical protein